jgi:hypothetical protein
MNCVTFEATPIDGERRQRALKLSGNGSFRHLDHRRDYPPFRLGGRSTTLGLLLAKLS